MSSRLLTGSLSKSKFCVADTFLPVRPEPFRMITQRGNSWGLFPFFSSPTTSLFICCYHPCFVFFSLSLSISLALSLLPFFSFPSHCICWKAYDCNVSTRKSLSSQSGNLITCNGRLDARNGVGKQGTEPVHPSRVCRVLGPDILLRKFVILFGRNRL